LVAVKVKAGGIVAVVSGIKVGNGGIVAVLVAVKVGEGGIVAVGVVVGRVVEVLVGTQPPCITLPEATSESIVDGELAKEFCFIREAFTALNDRQVNGISKPIRSASNASRIRVVLFLLLSSIPTSLSQ